MKRNQALEMLHDTWLRLKEYEGAANKRSDYEKRLQEALEQLEEARFELDGANTQIRNMEYELNEFRDQGEAGFTQADIDHAVDKAITKLRIDYSQVCADRDAWAHKHQELEWSIAKEKTEKKGAKK